MPQLLLETSVIDLRENSGKGRRLMLLSTTMGIGGGAEDQVMQLALELDSRGWKMIIVSMIPAEPVLAEFASREIRVVDLGMKVGMPDPRAILRLNKLIREFQPDILHTHMTHANLLGRIARLFTKVPVVISTLHGFKMYGINSRFTAFRELAHRVTDPLAEATTAICNAATEYYLQSGCVPASKLLSLPNGLDTTAFQPDAEARMNLRRTLELKGFVWLAVGRFESPKNYPLMLRAFARLQDRESTLVICGGGSQEAMLRALVNELNIASRVRFLGVRNDIRLIMNAADAFVLSSDTEGLPMVILQAAATGLPIVCTDVGGNREAVRDGVSGYIVPAGNQAHLTAAMNRLAGLQKKDRDAMGAAARSHILAHYDLQVVTDRWEELYTRLLAKN